MKASPTHCAEIDLAGLLLVRERLARENVKPVVVPLRAPRSGTPTTVEAGVKILQSNTPVRRFDIYFVCFHPMKDCSDMQMEDKHSLGAIGRACTTERFRTCTNEKKMNGYGKTGHFWNTEHDDTLVDNLAFEEPMGAGASVTSKRWPVRTTYGMAVEPDANSTSAHDVTFPPWQHGQNNDAPDRGLAFRALDHIRRMRPSKEIRRRQPVTQRAQQREASAT